MRENMMPQPPEGISELTGKKFIRHFENREKADGIIFGENLCLIVLMMQVSKNELNTARERGFCKNDHPDIVLFFGSGFD
jgi:hypothetical protein